jgi:uncharacterized repeat protein (TIGR03803 family)
MNRYRTWLKVAACSGLVAAVAACGDHDYGGYYPPPPIPTGDGLGPDAMIQGADGNFYGTTTAGGKYGLGAVFKVTPGGVESLIYSFAGGPANGATPQGVIQGSDGNFYGATAGGGSGPCSFGCGTVFKLTPTGVLTTLYFFSGATDGGVPNGVIQGSDGNFYGTTAFGGVTNNQCGSRGCGVVFKVTPAGVETALYAFIAGTTDGALPASLIQGMDGNYYGVTTYGGTSNDGTVFKVTPAGVETVLYAFAGGNDGELPTAPLTEGTDGNYYGSTPFGGVNGQGVVFKVTPAGVETLLHAFAGGSADGANPYTALIQGDRRQLLRHHQLRWRRELPGRLRHGVQADARRCRVDPLSLHRECLRGSPAAKPLEPATGDRQQLLWHDLQRRGVGRRRGLQTHPGRRRERAVFLRHE